MNVRFPLLTEFYATPELCHPPIRERKLDLRQAKCRIANHHEKASSDGFDGEGTRAYHWKAEDSASTFNKA